MFRRPSEDDRLRWEKAHEPEDLQPERQSAEPSGAASGLPDGHAWEQVTIDRLNRIVRATEAAQANTRATWEAAKATADAVRTIKTIVVIMFVLFVIGVLLQLGAFSTTVS